MQAGRHSRPRISERPAPTTVLWLAAQGCAAIVVLGSFAFRTTRRYPATGLVGETLQADGAARWAFGAFLLGLVALAFGAVYLSGFARPVVATAEAIALGWAARRAWVYWQDVLEQRDDPTRTYELTIAPGMRIVAVAGVAGAGAALLLALAIAVGLLLGSRRRP